MNAQPFVLAFVVMLGACIGSFLNVCIFRLPFQKSVLWPASHCLSCLKPIRAVDNIPLLSWLLLRGRCRNCGAVFSPRYMFVEAFTAGLFGFVFWAQAPQAPADYIRLAYQLLLLIALIVATFIDLDLQIIPDSVTVPLMLAGLLLGTWFPGGQLLLVSAPVPDMAVLGDSGKLIYLSLILLGWVVWVGGLVWQIRGVTGPPGPAEIVLVAAAFLYLTLHSVILALNPIGQPDIWLPDHPHCQGFATSLIGLLVGAATVWAVRVVGTAAFRKEAMGFGDVTLMAMVGGFLGWQAVVLVFFLAPFMALAIGLVQWVARGNNVIPYGPYLSLATLIVIVFWDRIWSPAMQGRFRVLGLSAPMSIGVGLVLLCVVLWCLVITRKHMAMHALKQ